MQYMFKSSISWSLSVIFNAVFDIFFFFPQPMKVEQWWKRHKEREREREM